MTSQKRARVYLHLHLKMSVTQGRAREVSRTLQHVSEVDMGSVDKNDNWYIDKCRCTLVVPLHATRAKVSALLGTPLFEKCGHATI